MTISNYPRGFNEGVLIRNLRYANPSGKIFYVGNNATLLVGEKGASDSLSNGGTFYKPFSTPDYAVGQCKANRGDIIILRPNYSESLIADSGVDIDVAGVTVIGMGNGEDRPTFTFTTDVDADFKIAAANVAVFNCIFKCNIASQVMMIETSGDDFEIGFCEFREGSATGLNLITIGVADNDSDRGYIHDCKFYMPTAGNGDSAISFAKDHAGVTIDRCEIYGDFDLAGIDIPTAGNAQVNCNIRSCTITNLLTGQHAIQANGTANTGTISEIYAVTDTVGTDIDAGGLEMFNCYHNDGTDGAGWTPIGTAADSAGNILGADNANNAFASTNVVANENGSIIERLEQIQEAINIGTGSSLNANSSIIDQEANLVIKQSTVASATSSTAIFTVTGDVEVAVQATIATGVTSSGSLTLEVGVASQTAALIAQTAKAQLVQHVSWVDASSDLVQPKPSYSIISNGEDILETVGTAGASAGVVDYYCWWRPLSSDGVITAV